MNGYVQLRRGIYDHLPDMLDSELKVYIAVLCRADIKTGLLKTSLREFGDEIGITSSRLSARLRRLAGPHGKEKTAYLDYLPSANQHHLTEIRVIKWKQSAVTNMDTAESAASAQQARSTDAVTCGNNPLENLGEEFFEKSSFENTGEARERAREGDIAIVGREYERMTGQTCPSAQFVALCADHPTERIMEGIRLAAEGGKADARYIGGIVRRLAKEAWEPAIEEAASSGRMRDFPSDFGDAEAS